MTDKSAWGGNDDTCTRVETTLLLLVAYAIVATIYGNGTDAIEIVGETLHGLVDLLCQFTRWSHDDAVDSILGVIAFR